jgi:hypothetical protein
LTTALAKKSLPAAPLLVASSSFEKSLTAAALLLASSAVEKILTAAVEKSRADRTRV